MQRSMLAQLAARMRAHRALFAGEGTHVGLVAHGMGHATEGGDENNEGEEGNGPLRVVVGEDCAVQ